MEPFRNRTQGINFKRPLLNLLPRNNKIFVSVIVNLPSMRNLQHIALASFPPSPLPRHRGWESFSWGLQLFPRRWETPGTHSIFQQISFSWDHFSSNLRVNVTDVFHCIGTKEVKFQLQSVAPTGTDRVSTCIESSSCPWESTDLSALLQR